MRTKLIKLIFSFAVLFGVIGMTDKAMAETEPNDSFLQPNNINVNEVQTGTTSSAKDEDWFRFTTDADSYFQVKFGSSIFNDQKKVNSGWDVSVYRESDLKNPIKKYTSITTKDLVSTRFPYSNEIIYVKISSHSENSIIAPVDCDYTLTIYESKDPFYEKEMNDEPEYATPIQLDKTYSGSFLSSSDTDWYIFDKQDKGVFTLEFAEQEEYDLILGWDVVIYKEGDLINPVKRYNNIQSSLNTKTLSLGTGKFYVKVMNDFAPNGAIDCVYNIKINNISEDCWECESNNINDNSNNISTNSVVKGSLFSSKDIDWYQFDITKMGYFNIDFVNSLDNSTSELEYGWNISVFEASNLAKPIKVFKNIKNSINTTNLPFGRGHYYVKIEPYISSDVPVDYVYNFTVNEIESEEWESEHNDKFESADSLTLNNNKCGLLHEYNDEDWYTFTTTNKGYFNVQLISDSDNNPDKINNGWNVYVYKASDLTTPIVKGSGVKTNWNSGKLGFEPGKYYVKVCGYSKSLGEAPTDCTYIVKPEFYTNEYWESEDNNSYEKADLINLGRTYYGNLYKGTDKDFYKITIPAAGNVAFALKNYEGMNSKDGWNVYVYKSSDLSEPVTKLTAVKSSNNSTVYLSKGIYCIKVEAASYNKPELVTYSLSTAFVYSKTTISKMENVSATSIKITWSKDSNVGGYIVYRSTSRNGSYKKIATISKNSTVSFIDTKLTAGKTYYYKVAKYGVVNNKTFYGIYSSPKGLKAIPAKVRLKSVMSQTKMMKVKWNCEVASTGYQVQYSTKSSFKSGSTTGYMTIKGNKTVTKTIKKLKSGKKYYVRVRAYKTVGGKKVYGAWSNVIKSPKIK